MVFRTTRCIRHDGCGKHVVRAALKHYPKAEIKTRVDEAARMLDITNSSTASRSNCRVASPARCDGPRHRPQSKVFLFDEPLSNLDAKLRVQMRIEIKKVHQKVRTTTST